MDNGRTVDFHPTHSPRIYEKPESFDQPKVIKFNPLMDANRLLIKPYTSRQREACLFARH